MKKVIIASKNPVKINAVKQSFQKVFPYETFTFESISAKSEVADQPMSSIETLKGAINRTNNAKIKEADFYVGIEGGLEKIENEMESFAWIVIQSKDKMSKAKTATYNLPPKIIELIEQGYELGKADDILFKQENTKQEMGNVGLLTDNLIDRTKFYEQAIIFALVPHKKLELY